MNSRESFNTSKVRLEPRKLKSLLDDEDYFQYLEGAIRAKFRFEWTSSDTTPFNTSKVRLELV